MAIESVQLLYRLKNYVRLLIDEIDGPDSIKLYWSQTESGTYVLLEELKNRGSEEPAIRNKIVYEFYPEDKTIDDNERFYIKMSTVTGGVESSQEGPMIIYTKSEIKQPAELNVIYGYSKDLDKHIPVLVDKDGKVITTT